MKRGFFFPGLILMIAALACSRTPSSGGSMRDIACALQGVPPQVCNPATSAPLDVGASGDDSIPAPSPGGEEIPVSASTPTPTAPPESILKVVYARSGNIWLWDGVSTNHLTASGLDSDPRISDDGTLVAFRRNGGLWVVNADGTRERLLVSAGNLAALPHVNSGPPALRLFDFAPKSHDVYFNTTLLGESFSTPEYNLAKVNADNPSLQSLLNNDQGGGQFTFSPDGRKIALARNDKINVVNSNGSDLKTVFTFPSVMMYSEVSYIPQVAWLPDGSGFKTVIPAQDQLANPSAPTRFMFIPVDGSQAAQLAEFVAGPAFANRPYISPDGSKVLYVKQQGANLELHVIDAGTADRAYFWYPARNFGILGWAPDSIGVIYWVDDTRRTWLGSLDNPAVPLSDVGFADRVTWLDTKSYLFINENELRIRSIGQPSVLIDSGVKGELDVWRRSSKP